MKFSELDISKLSLEERYELIMHGIQDYARVGVSEDTKADFLIVLGCRPVPLKARIIKAAELYKKGHAKYLLFSGGHGWNKKVEVASDKDREMIEAVKNIVSPQLIGQVVNEKEQAIEEKMHMTPEERLEELDAKIRNLSECQLMTKMMITLGDVPQSHIFHEPFSNNTVENIKYTEALFRSIVKRGEVPKIDSVMLVTSSFHCRRAVLTFRKYFKKFKILACPTTLDFKEKGLRFCKEDILNSEYYRTQIENELNAIVNYTKNSSIEDCDIAEVVDKKTAKRIEDKHRIIAI